jgi:hypothetical protein
LWIVKISDGACSSESMLLTNVTGTYIIISMISAYVKENVKLSLCLIKYQAVETCGGLGV